MTDNGEESQEVHEAGEYELVATRDIPAPPALVYEAWSNPEHLSQWWGPNGFTNTFRRFEFRPGGIWEFVMHGPNGVDYPNVSEFVEIGPDRIALRHLCAPFFRLTATFEEAGGATRLTWRQQFENAAVFDNVKKIAHTANRENLERLEAQLRKMSV